MASDPGLLLLLPSLRLERKYPRTFLGLFVAINM